MLSAYCCFSQVEKPNESTEQLDQQVSMLMTVMYILHPSAQQVCWLLHHFFLLSKDHHNLIACSFLFGCYIQNKALSFACIGTRSLYVA